MYAKWDNGIMLVAEEATQGYKPMITTEPPEAPEGYHAAFYWLEESEAFVQTWEIVPTIDDVDDSEALRILLGVEE